MQTFEEYQFKVKHNDISNRKSPMFELIDFLDGLMNGKEDDYIGVEVSFEEEIHLLDTTNLVSILFDASEEDSYQFKCNDENDNYKTMCFDYVVKNNKVALCSSILNHLDDIVDIISDSNKYDIDYWS